MSTIEINLSGAEGSGTSVKIYETPNYEYPWQGACVMHGSFTVGPSSPDNQRIETVTLYMCGMKIQVRAADVDAELKELREANKTGPVDKQESRQCAFNALSGAVMGIASRHLTLEHLEKLVQAAFEEGVRAGRGHLQDQIRTLLGL